MTLELSLAQLDLKSRVGCFAYNTFHVLVHAWRWCEGLKKEHSINSLRAKLLLEPPPMSKYFQTIPKSPSHSFYCDHNGRRLEGSGPSLNFGKFED